MGRIARLQNVRRVERGDLVELENASRPVEPQGVGVCRAQRFQFGHQSVLCEAEDGARGATASVAVHQISDGKLADADMLEDLGDREREDV